MGTLVKPSEIGDPSPASIISGFRRRSCVARQVLIRVEMVVVRQSDLAAEL